jgi:hypothetical protein
MAAANVSWTGALMSAASASPLPTASTSLLGKRRKRQNQEHCKQTR